MRKSLPKRDQLLLRIGAAKKEAGRAFGFVKIQMPSADQAVTRETLSFQVDKAKLKISEQRDGQYLLRSNLTGEDSEDNLRKSISCYEAALLVYNRKAFPYDWARVQSSLGSAYFTLSSGDRETNSHKAIGCYRAALLVFNDHDTPCEWASTQHNLGNAYSNIHNAQRPECLKRALACYEEALHTFLMLHMQEHAQGVRENLDKVRDSLSVLD